jgi:hypothetical protein
MAFARFSNNSDSPSLNSDAGVAAGFASVGSASEMGVTAFGVDGFGVGVAFGCAVVSSRAVGPGVLGLDSSARAGPWGTCRHEHATRIAIGASSLKTLLAALLHRALDIVISNVFVTVPSRAPAGLPTLKRQPGYLWSEGTSRMIGVTAHGF